MLEERKKFMYKGYEYAYKVVDHEILKTGSLCMVTVVGGPDRAKAYSSCPRADVKSTIKKLITSIEPKKLGPRTKKQQARYLARMKPR